MDEGRRILYGIYDRGYMPATSVEYLLYRYY